MNVAYGITSWLMAGTVVLVLLLLHERTRLRAATGLVLPAVLFHAIFEPHLLPIFAAASFLSMWLGTLLFRNRELHPRRYLMGYVAIAVAATPLVAATIDAPGFTLTVGLLAGLFAYDLQARPRRPGRPPSRLPQGLALTVVGSLGLAVAGLYTAFGGPAGAATAAVGAPAPAAGPLAPLLVFFANVADGLRHSTILTRFVTGSGVLPGGAVLTGAALAALSVIRRNRRPTEAPPRDPNEAPYKLPPFRGPHRPLHHIPPSPSPKFRKL